MHHLRTCYIRYTTYVAYWCSMESVVAHENYIACAVTVTGWALPTRSRVARPASTLRPLDKQSLTAHYASRVWCISSRFLTECPLRRPSSSNRLEASACCGYRIQSLTNRTAVRIQEVVSRARCHIKVRLVLRLSSSAFPLSDTFWRNSHRADDRTHSRARDIRSDVLH